MTAIGKPYKFSDFAQPTVTPLYPSGIIFALDKDTGKKLWEFNVVAPIGVIGPSIGHGMLFVPTGAPNSAGPENKGGDVIAFGLPPSPENQTLSIGNTTK
jgi:outer membrane protein assembly factor BamB